MESSVLVVGNEERKREIRKLSFTTNSFCPDEMTLPNSEFMKVTYYLREMNF